MIISDPPKGFEAEINFQGEGCFMEHGSKVLFLKRASHLSLAPTKWGGPGGKIEEGETPIRALIREIQEETGIVVRRKNFPLIAKLFIIYPEFKFTYELYRITLTGNRPEIVLSGEHTDYTWICPLQAIRQLDLMEDEDSCLQLAYNL